MPPQELTLPQEKDNNGAADIPVTNCIEHVFDSISGDRPCLLAQPLNKSFPCRHLASSLFHTWPGSCLNFNIPFFRLIERFSRFPFGYAYCWLLESLKVWVVGHGLDPLYEHVATEWKEFCQQDDTEKRKYSALWYINTSHFYILYIQQRITFHCKVRE